jgi:hypothetical protein
MLYTFLQPVQYVLNADSVNEAIKNYVKFHRFHNINKIMLKDQMTHYKANLKYFKYDGRNKVGINVYPMNTVPIVNTPGVVNTAPYANPVSPAYANSVYPAYANSVYPAYARPGTPPYVNPFFS